MYQSFDFGSFRLFSYPEIEVEFLAIINKSSLLFHRIRIFYQQKNIFQKRVKSIFDHPQIMMETISITSNCNCKAPTKCLSILNLGFPNTMTGLGFDIEKLKLNDDNCINVSGYFSAIFFIYYVWNLLTLFVILVII